MRQFLFTFIAVFVALDIVGTLPMFVSMTHGMPVAERKRTINTSMIVALAVALVFLCFGKVLFRFMGIEIFDFKIAGGVVLLLVSLADLLGGPGVVQRTSGSTGIVPLAVPLITGPGVLTTIILQSEGVGPLITFIALLLNYGLAWAALRKSAFVTKMIGTDGTVVVSKLAALLLAAIAVAMIRGGVFDSIHSFH